MSKHPLQNLYEVLQVSPNAEQLVITKVYRLLAAYYHPDNKQTGDEERFKLVLKAYEVLSDPAKRSRYDLESLGRATSQAQASTPGDPSSGQSEFREELKSRFGTISQAYEEREFSERELRRFMLMALYDVRRNTPSQPQLSLLVLSELLGCSIGNLEFSTWYLKEKGYINISESADFSITIAGVDYVEIELLRKESEKQVLSLPEGRA